VVEERRPRARHSSSSGADLVPALNRTTPRAEAERRPGVGNCTPTPRPYGEPSEMSPAARRLGALAPSLWPVALMVLATLGAWLPLYLQRRAAHQPNFDDYLYTIQSLNLAHAGSFTSLVHAVLHTGHEAPLVLLLAAPGALRGVDGAVAVQLPLLLLLTGGAWLLARRWVTPRQAALIGFVTAANQAVLGWALMLNFSVAASTLCLWSLAGYLWSDGFRRWGWSLVTGLSVGLLLVSRSLAPMYVATLVVVIGIDLVRRRRLPRVQAGLAVLIALAVAGPWWLVSGGIALDYLKTAGYQASSGFARSGAHLTPSSILDRARWTLSDLGTLQSVILLAAPITAVVQRRRMPGALLVAGWLLLTLVGLATSSNRGTGFGLPVVAVSITLTGALIMARRPPPASSATRPTPASPPGVAADAGASPALAARVRTRRALLLVGRLIVTLLILALVVRAISSNAGTGFGLPLVAIIVVLAGALMTFRPLAAVLVVTVIGLGFAAEWSGNLSQSWLGPPYRQMALQATNGARVPNIDAVHHEIARAIAGSATLLVRDDDLLNSNGLVYAAMTEHLSLPLTTPPYGDATAGVRELKGMQLLLAGNSPVNFHDLSENRLDHHYTRLVETAAAQDGWAKVHVWRLACGNTIDLWRKAAPGSSERVAAPAAKGTSYGGLVLADSPAAFWRLGDKACGPADASGNGNTGTYAGGPGLGAHALIADPNTSVHFDGRNDEITFPDSASLSPTKAISVEAWVRPDIVPTASGSVWQLISKWNTALLYLQGGASPKFAFALYDTASSSYASVVVGTTTVAADTVYHVVGTYDGSTMRIYVNGSLEATLVRHGSVNNSSYGGAIAYKGWGTLPSPHFQGRLDEIAIYKTALTPTQVQTHDSKGTAG
jgi:hypothetical protein